MIELTPDRILVRKAERFATEKHKGQAYGEQPYTYHLEGVVRNVILRKKEDPLLSTYVAVAWLHDVMEDCGVTHKELVDEFGLCIAECVRRLTRTKEISYKDYLIGCIESAIALEVKICDTMFNLNESFRTGRDKGLNKYPRQLDILIKGVYFE